MPTETLICDHGGHEFTRERKRGVKPHLCPEHKASTQSASASRPKVNEPVSKVLPEARALLASPGLDREVGFKLRYVVKELESPRITEPRDNEESEKDRVARIALLTEVQGRLLKENRRQVMAA